MSRFLNVAVILLSAAASPPILAAPPAAGTQNETALAANALELARLLNPVEEMVSTASKTYDEAFNRGAAEEGGVSELEKDHPGITAELRRATREAALADLRSDMPAVHRRYARFFANQFTDEELTELVAFYRSPTGAKIIQAKFANMDFSSMIDRFTKNPDAKLSTGDIDQLNDGALSGVWQGLSAEDFKALMNFGLRPVAKKLGEAAPKMTEIETEIANEPDAALDAAIDEAARKVYERYGLTGETDDR